MIVLGIFLLAVISMTYAVLCIFKKTDIIMGLVAGMLGSYAVYGAFMLVMVWFSKHNVMAAVLFTAAIGLIADFVIVISGHMRVLKDALNVRNSIFALIAGIIVFMGCEMYMNSSFYGCSMVGKYQVKTMAMLEDYWENVGEQRTIVAKSIYNEKEYEQYEETINNLGEEYNQPKNAVIVYTMLSAEMFGIERMMTVIGAVFGGIVFWFVILLSYIVYVIYRSGNKKEVLEDISESEKKVLSEVNLVPERKMLIVKDAASAVFGIVISIVVLIAVRGVFSSQVIVCSFSEFKQINHVFTNVVQKTIIVDENMAENWMIPLGSYQKGDTFVKIGSLKENIERVYDFAYGQNKYGEKIYYMTDRKLSEQEIQGVDNQLKLVSEGDTYIYVMQSGVINPQTRDDQNMFEDNLRIGIIAVFSIICFAYAVFRVLRGSRLGAIMISAGAYVWIFMLLISILNSRSYVIKDAAVMTFMISIIAGCVSELYAYISGKKRKTGKVSYSKKMCFIPLAVIVVVWGVCADMTWIQMTTDIKLQKLQISAIAGIYPDMNTTVMAENMNMISGIMAATGRMLGYEAMHMAAAVVISSIVLIVSGIVCELAEYPGKKKRYAQVVLSVLTVIIAVTGLIICNSRYGTTKKDIAQSENMYEWNNLYTIKEIVRDDDVIVAEGQKYKELSGYIKAITGADVIDYDEYGLNIQNIKDAKTTHMGNNIYFISDKACNLKLLGKNKLGSIYQYNGIMNAEEVRAWEY